MLGKGEALLIAQQIARVERANKRRVDKEKLQEVLNVSNNLVYNLTPSLGYLRVDEGIVSLELVKHPNSLENFQD